MSDNQIKAGVFISAQVDGVQNIKQLGNELNHASQETQNLAEQSKKLNRLNEAKATLGLNVDDATRKEIEKLDAAFISLKQSGKLSHAELARAADLHRDKIYQLERKLGDLRPSLADIADEVQGVVTKSAGLAYAANEAMKFETAMAAVKKVTDGTDEEYAKLSGSIKTLAGQLGIMPAELAEIAAQGGQMGVAMERLPEFTEMAAQMSIAFGISADKAGELAAKTSNVFGLQMDGMRDLGDAINTLGNTTAAKEAEISEVLLRIGGNSKQFGLSAKEAAALGAAFISLGKSPEVASTAINAMLTKLQNAKNGTTDFKDALKDLGYNAEELAAQIAANPQAALSDFLAKLGELDKQTRSEMLGQLFGTEYSDDIALLTGSLDTYKKALDNATDSEKTFGAMKRETDAALETTAAKVNQAKANLANAAIELGNALLPAIQAAAAGVGGVAETLGAISQQFPVLTQLAALFMGVKVAITAYQTAMRLSGQESAASFLKSDVGAKKLKISILEAASAAKVLGNNMKAALKDDIGSIDVKTNAVGKLKASLGGAAQGALSLWSAWEVGNSLGQGLYENSELARTFGDELGRVMAIAHSLGTTGSLDQYREHFRTSKEAAREAEEAAKKAAKAKAEQEAAEKRAGEEQAAVINQLIQKRAALNEQIAANERSMVVLNEAGKTSGAIYTDLAAKNETLRQQLAATNAELMKHNANISDASPLLKQRQALESLGLTAEQVATGISKSAQQALDDFSLAGAQFGVNADSMSRMFQAALQKMDSPEAVAKLKESLATVGKQAGLTEAEIRAIGEAAPEVANKVQAAFDKIGVDTEAVMSGISTEAKQAMADFQAASDAARAQGVQDARLIAAGFEQMMTKLKSPEAFAAFKQQLEQSGDAAKLTTEQLNRLNHAAQEGAIAAKTAYEQLAESLKAASDTRSVQAAGQAAEQAMKRGEISAEQYQEVLKQVRDRTEEIKQKSEQAGSSAAKAHQEASQSAKSATQATEKQANAQAKNTEETQKATAATHNQTKSISQLAMAMQQYYARINNPTGWWDIGTGMANHARIASGAWRSFVEYMKQVRQDLSDVTRDLSQSLETGINLTQNLARAESLAANHAEKLDKTTLNNLHAQIDKAKQKMQSLTDEAANARQAAEKELLSIQGKDDEVARLEQQKKLNELQQKRQQAQKAGHAKAAEDYQRAIAISEQVFAEKQRKEREAAEAQRQQEEQQKREAAEREAQQKQQALERQAQTVQMQPEIKLQMPAIDVGNIDLSGLSQQLSERDKQLVEQVKQAIIGELTKQMKNQT